MYKQSTEREIQISLNHTKGCSTTFITDMQIKTILKYILHLSDWKKNL